MWLLQGARIIFAVLCIGLFFRLAKQWKARRRNRPPRQRRL
jgi:hypothetical protein